MPSLPLSLLLLPLLLLSGPAPASRPGPGPGRLEPRPRHIGDETALERIERWVGELREKGQLEWGELAGAVWVISDVALAWEAAPERRREIATSVLDLSGQLLAREYRGQAEGPTARSERELRERTNEFLSRRVGDVGRWLALEVAPMERGNSVARRAAACKALAADPGPEARMALFVCTGSAAPLLRDTALEALVGRDDPSVHTRLLGLLEEAEAGRSGVRQGSIERHFRAVQLAPDSAAHARATAYVRARLTDERWRRASRAVSIGHCLDERTVCPMLVESLQVWITREAAGVPSRRVQGEILRELERRSGRRLGLRPERWRQWWKAVQAGQIDFEGHGESGGGFSQASFFGLRAMTDRVTFVLDRSGSMETEFGAGRFSSSEGRSGRTRMREAVTQMSRYLERLGPGTRFNVVLFSDDAVAWERRLRAARVGNVQAAARWAIGHGTGGGTNLRAGVERAMGLDDRGRLDLDELEVDTIIVLCDGETAEGPAWVRPLLRRVNDEARLLFHAVQIGGVGDGTLEALCDETGGDFIEVDG